MKSKQLWTIVGISLVVALAVTLVSGAVSSGPLFSPKTSANAYVKAHSCDADGSCEINDAVVGGNLEYVGNLIGMDCEVFSLRGTPAETCKNAGYTTCVAREVTDVETYFNSTSRSCQGGIQVKMKNYRMVSCNGDMGGAACASNNIGAEPYYGDVSKAIGLEPDDGRVLCCR